MKVSYLIWLAATAATAIAQGAAQDGGQTGPVSIAELSAVEVSVVFPRYDQVKGQQVARITNGQDTELTITVTNNEAKDLTVSGIAGSFLDKQHKSVSNLTTVPAGPITVKPAAAQTLRHTITGLNIAPYDFDLALVLLAEYDGQLAAIEVPEQPVAVYDPSISFFDPRLILVNLILAVTMAGAGYAAVIYGLPLLGVNLAPTKPKSKSRAKAAASSPAVGSSTGVNGKGYDESWIPKEHLKRKN